MARNWEYAAGLLWPVLVKKAKAKKKVFYSELAPLIDTNPLSVRNALDPIQRHCMDYKLPPLTAIVIGKTKGRPGQGFIAWDIDNIEGAYETVYRHNWDTVENPFGGFNKDDTTETLSRALVDDPDKSEEIYAKIKVRGPAQAIFRAALLTAYDGACSICGLSFKEALDAAHIIRWSKASHAERIAPRNGILLCSNHHKLFDSGRIQISEDFKVVDKYDGENCHGGADKAATVAFHHQPLRLPKNKELWPSRELVRKRLQGDPY